MEAIFTRLTAVFDRVNAIPEERKARMVGLMTAGPAWAVLLIAAWLTPAAEGFGTHRQLGLGGCTMLTVTGWPCPMCGMTTTFALFAHFRPVEAVLNQPFGAVLFPATVIAAVVGAWDVLTGRGLGSRVFDWVTRRERFWAMFLLIGMGLGWVYKMVRMHPEVFGVG